MKLNHKTLFAIAGLFIVNAPVTFAAQPVVFHEVDVQQTFWEGMNGKKAGPLAVPGSTAITENIKKIKAAVFADRNLKAVASIDWHLQFEVDHPEIFGEFKMFASHGRAELTGPEGADRIPEVELFPKSRQVVIPHHAVTDGKFNLVPVNLKKLKKAILNSQNEIIIQKNGEGSYSVFANPRTEQIYKILNPKAIFVYGVATDFCVQAASLGFSKRGYKVYVISDAISGIFPEGTAAKIKEMKDAGAIFVTTDEALKLAKTLSQN